MKTLKWKPVFAVLGLAISLTLVWVVLNSGLPTTRAGHNTAQIPTSSPTPPLYRAVSVGQRVPAPANNQAAPSYLATA